MDAQYRDARMRTEREESHVQPRRWSPKKPALLTPASQTSGFQDARTPCLVKAKSAHTCVRINPVRGEVSRPSGSRTRLLVDPAHSLVNVPCGTVHGAVRVTYGAYSFSESSERISACASGRR